MQAPLRVDRLPAFKRGFISLATLILSVIIGGCAAPTQVTAPAVMLETVPFIAQDANACGPASLAMVLQYYGHAHTQDQLKPLLLLPEREGTLQIELTAAARREGLLALAGPSELNTLIAQVTAGWPVIVLQNLRFEFWPQWHYAVVIGVDQQHSTVLLRSGSYPLIETPFSTFRNTWERSKRWSLVVSPPGRLPPGVDVTDVIAASEALVASGHPTAALAAYFSAARQWPDNIHVWNGMANLAYGQQRWPLSQQAFAQSLHIDSHQPRIWNNFAYALGQTGCKAQSDSALRCALAQAPQDPLLQDSAAELNALRITEASACTVTISAQCTLEGITRPEIRLQ